MGRPKGTKNKVDPATIAAGDAKPKSENKKSAPPKLTVKSAEGVVDTIQSLAMLIGHNPDPGERKAATLGLLAASRKSPFIAKLLSGSLLVGDTAIIILGLGGMAARIGTDVLAQKDETMQPIRDKVHLFTSLAYGMIDPGVKPEQAGNNLMDLVNMFEGENTDALETRGTRGDNRGNGFGQDLSAEEIAGISQT